MYLRSLLGTLAFTVCAGCATTMATTTNSGAPARTTLFSRYDRVEGKTDVTAYTFYGKHRIGGPVVNLQLRASHPDTVLSAALPGVSWVFEMSTGTGSGWRWQRGASLSLLVDDTARMSFEGVTDIGSIGGTLKSESAAFRVPTSDMQRIGSASVVEGRVGDWSFALTPAEIGIVREMAMYAAADPSAPRPARGRVRN